MPGDQFLDMTRKMAQISTDLGGRCETVREAALKAAGLLLEIGKKAGPEVGAQLATISEAVANVAVFLGEIGSGWRDMSGVWNEVTGVVEKAAKK